MRERRSAMWLSVGGRGTERVRKVQKRGKFCRYIVVACYARARQKLRSECYRGHVSKPCGKLLEARPYASGIEECHSRWRWSIVSISARLRAGFCLSKLDTVTTNWIEGSDNDIDMFEGPPCVLSRVFAREQIRGASGIRTAFLRRRQILTRLPHIYRSLWRGCSTNWRVRQVGCVIIEPLIIGIAERSYAGRGRMRLKTTLLLFDLLQEGCLRDGNSDKRIAGWPKASARICLGGGPNETIRHPWWYRHENKYFPWCEVDGYVSRIFIAELVASSRRIKCVTKQPLTISRSLIYVDVACERVMNRYNAHGWSTGNFQRPRMYTVRPWASSEEGQHRE